MKRLSRMFPGRRESISDARAFARAFVVGRSSDDLADTAELVVSELCTNAVAIEGSHQAQRGVRKREPEPQPVMRRWG